VDLDRGVLKGPEAGDKDVGEHHEILRPLVVLVEPPEDTRGDEFAECRSGKVDILTILEV